MSTEIVNVYLYSMSGCSHCRSDYVNLANTSTAHVKSGSSFFYFFFLCDRMFSISFSHRV